MIGNAPSPEESRAFHACVLSVVAGYADTLGYLTFDAFAGLMTGNTVLLGIALAHGQPLQAARNAAIIVVFLSGVACAACCGAMAPS
jgi:uncharacterized membrane protein YoaK (UPF0700 family)